MEGKIYQINFYFKIKRSVEDLKAFDVFLDWISKIMPQIQNKKSLKKYIEIISIKKREV